MASGAQSQHIPLYLPVAKGQEGFVLLVGGVDVGAEVTIIV